MPLIPTTLGSGLGSMSPTDQEQTAINNFATAWESYFSGASVMGIPTTPGSLSGAISALKGALSGMSQASAGATAIQTAIAAFWGVVAASAVTIWATPFPITSATPPPGLSGIGAALMGAFAANTSADNSLSAAANQIATAIHTTQLGGIAIVATVPTTTPSPIL